MATVFAASTGIGRADVFTMDFDTDDSGNPMVAGTTDLAATDPYANLFAPGFGVRIFTDRPALHPLNLYYSEGVGGFDNDLERNSTGSGNWEGGTETSTVFNNLLIINEFADISIVDDEGSGGDMRLVFDVALQAFGFDFVDMDAAAGATLLLTDASTTTTVSIPFADFEDASTSIHRTPGALFGDRNANRILDITAAELGLAQIDEVIFRLTSSGGIGTVHLDTLFAVPEADSLSLLLGAFGLLGFRFRRCAQS